MTKKTNDGRTKENQLTDLIEYAKKTKKLLHTGYKDLWFTPDELLQLNEEGLYIWGLVNWSLRRPEEKIADIKNLIKRHCRIIRDLGDDLADWERKIKDL